MGVEELRAHVQRRSHSRAIEKAAQIGQPDPASGSAPAPPRQKRPLSARNWRYGGPVIDPRRHLTATVTHGAPFFPGGLTPTQKSSFTTYDPYTELRCLDNLSNRLPQQRDWHRF